MGLFSSTSVKPMTPDERLLLARHEATIAAGLKAFQAVGDALTEIRDRQLYREAYESFDDYLLAKWKIDKSYAARLIAAAEVARNLLPIGNKPRSESVARPLAALLADDQREVWKDVVATAPKAADGTPKVTAKAVEHAVSVHSKTKKKKPKALKPVRFKVPGAIVIVAPNRKFGGDVVAALRCAIAKYEATSDQKRAAA